MRQVIKTVHPDSKELVERKTIVLPLLLLICEDRRRTDTKSGTIFHNV